MGYISSPMGISISSIKTLHGFKAKRSLAPALGSRNAIASRKSKISAPFGTVTKEGTSVVTADARQHHKRNIRFSSGGHFPSAGT
jgi:hypothetical protein